MYVIEMPTSFQYKGKTLTNDFEIANGFNDYFASIGQEMADSMPDTPGYEEYLKFTKHRFSLEPLETSDLEEIMTKQQPKLSCGLDSIGLVWFGLYFDNVHTIKYTFKNGHYPGELHLMEDVASHRATE